jgi:hypothetical protein
MGRRRHRAIFGAHDHQHAAHQRFDQADGKAHDACLHAGEPGRGGRLLVPCHGGVAGQEVCHGVLHAVPPVADQLLDAEGDGKAHAAQHG